MKLYLRIFLIMAAAALASALLQAGLSGVMLHKFSAILNNDLSDVSDHAMKRSSLMTAKTEAALAASKINEIFDGLESIFAHDTANTVKKHFFEKSCKSYTDSLIVFRENCPVVCESNPFRSEFVKQNGSKAPEYLRGRIRSALRNNSRLICESKDDPTSFWLVYVKNKANIAAARINGKSFLHSLIRIKDEGAVLALTSSNFVLAEYTQPDRRPEVSMRAIRRFIFSDLNGRLVLADGSSVPGVIRFMDAPNWYPSLVPVECQLNDRTMQLLTMLPEPEGITILSQNLNTALRRMTLWFLLFAVTGSLIVFFPAAWICVRGLSDRLRQILVFTGKIADGKAHAERLSLSGSSEYREFAELLNLLHDRFSAAMARLKKCREEEMNSELDSEGTRLLRGGMMAAMVSGMRRALHLIRGYSSLQKGRLEPDLPEGIAAKKMEEELRYLASSLRGLEELSLPDILRGNPVQMHIDIPGLMRRAIINAGSEAALRGQMLETRCSHDPAKEYCSSPSVILHLFTSSLLLLSETAARNSRISLTSAEEGDKLVFLCRSFRNARETELSSIYGEYLHNGYVSSALAAPILLRLKILEMEVKALEGSMKLFHPEDGGSAINFVFPLRNLRPVPGDDGKMPRRIRPAVRINRKEQLPVTVCVADDSPSERQLIALLLKNSGYQLTVPDSIMEAVQLLKQRSFDILLADAGDDLMSIRSFLDQVPQHTAVAAMTAAAVDTCTPLKYLLSGADICIPKPLTAAGLLEALHHLER